MVYHILIKMAAFNDIDKDLQEELQDESVKTSYPISEYAKKLTGSVKQRYLDKISNIGIDPVLISEKKYSPECLPPVEAADLLSYLVLDTSFYTNKQFKAFRSLQAYNQMVSGFITSVQGHIIAKRYVVLAKVRHSQRMNDPPVSLWVITHKDGTIICAHCTGCMAGLGECCSHIASVLFYLETWTRINGKLSCTQVKCTWLLPTYVKEVTYEKVKNINFTSARKLKTNLDNSIERLDQSELPVPQDSSTPKPRQSKKNKPVAKPSASEMDEFFAALNDCKIKPVALSLLQPYSEAFVLKSRTIKTIPDLFDEKYLNAPYDELIKACYEVNISVTDKEIDIIEKDTINQAKGSGFFRHRAGRIGASISKAASHTDPALPSQSLIKTICYPDLFKFSTAATEHGCQHEESAILAFEKVMKTQHRNFKVKRCGMVINKDYPWLHATADFLCSCDCCGEGCGEIKCPYCIDNCNFEQYIQKPSSCLEKRDDFLRLKENHQYYYQVQQQLFTTKRSYCDFVVYAINKEGSCFVHDRIYPNKSHWDKVVPKLAKFWRVGVLPEILGRWYTRSVRATSNDVISSEVEKGGVCFCRKKTDEMTFKCLNPLCEILEFHPSCLAVTSIPKTWYCPNCRKLPEFKPKKSKPSKDDEIIKRALNYQAICICQKKALENDKLIECHGSKCENGTLFHLPCLNYKRMPNNHKTTWVCFGCITKKSCSLKTYESESIEKNNQEENTNLGLLLDADDTDDIILTDVTTGSTSVNKKAKLANLTQAHFDIIKSSTGWLDCDIIHMAQVLLQNINQNIDGFQRPTLGPVRNFDIISGEFIQILHTGNKHWVCASNIGCVPGTVNIYDSLYHNVVEDEIKDQISSMLGDVFSDIDVIPVQQQSNGCDCGVFSIAFATCLVFQVKPESVQFINAEMRPHLAQCLRSSQMELFPVII